MYRKYFARIAIGDARARVLFVHIRGAFVARIARTLPVRVGLGTIVEGIGLLYGVREAGGILFLFPSFESAFLVPHCASTKGNI